MALLRRMNAEWPFFRTVLSNLDMVLAKADPSVARRYAELVPDRALAERIFAAIDAGQVERLVIDMRWNGGGNTFKEMPLLRQVIAHRKVNRRGALFVIILFTVPTPRALLVATAALTQIVHKTGARPPLSGTRDTPSQRLVLIRIFLHNNPHPVLPNRPTVHPTMPICRISIPSRHL